jgi:hypothetical protein
MFKTNRGSLDIKQAIHAAKKTWILSGHSNVQKTEKKIFQTP